ncbi:DUF6575 domain-containing protein [Pseudomonas petroselini]|uniref:DUF6575 domain-containing protein n=1 Tax=Pseudomonas petroselini TaxID=2899822 RepID=UPI00387084DC
MLSLPVSTQLGELTFFEVFEFFDFPRLFTCRNRSGSFFLVVSTYDDGERFEWLYLPISIDRINTLIDRRMNLNQAFLLPEDGYLAKVETNFYGVGLVEFIFPEQVPLDDLPTENAFLKSTTRKKYGLGAIDAEEAALSSNRETYNIHLYPVDTNLPEIGIRSLGHMLITSQELVDALGQTVEGNVTVKGPIPAAVLDKTRLNACQIFEGSFGIQFKSNLNVELFSNSLLAESLQLMMVLMLAGDDEDQLSNQLHLLRARVTSKYRAFLKEVKMLGSPIKIEWGSPNKELSKSVTLSREQVDKAYEIVSQIEVDMSTEHVVIAELLGLDTRTNRYRLRTNDNVEYSGKVLDEAVTSVRHSKINDMYKAVLKKAVQVSSMSGHETVRWLLVSLSKIE